MQAFQVARGLQADGSCDANTWSALVEASWELGDRQLLLTSPNMRGDDVADLQTRLARLGFDSGRVDGILGPRTARAITDFQANCGLVADGVCGPETLRTIERVSSQTGTGPGVATLHERERLRDGFRSVAHCRVVLGQFGGLSAVVRTLAHDLRQQGATVMTLDEPDPVAQAIAANHFAANVYVGFESRAESGVVAHYYQVPTFESVSGRALAEFLVQELQQELQQALPGERGRAGHRVESAGRRLPILRETRMAAVLLHVGPARMAADAAPQLAAAVLRALDLWMSREA